MNIKCMLGFHNYVVIKDSIIFVQEIIDNRVVEVPIGDEICVDCGKYNITATKSILELENRMQDESDKLLNIVRNNWL